MRAGKFKLPFFFKFRDLLYVLNDIKKKKVGWKKTHHHTPSLVFVKNFTETTAAD